MKVLNSVCSIVRDTAWFDVCCNVHSQAGLYAALLEQKHSDARR